MKKLKILLASAALFATTADALTLAKTQTAAKNTHIEGTADESQQVQKDAASDSNENLEAEEMTVSGSTGVAREPVRASEQTNSPLN